MRTVMVILLIIFIGLQAKLWLGEGGVREWRHLEKKLSAQEDVNRQLESRNHIMEAEINELKSGDQALEEEARYQLGMVKEGEVYYQFRDSP